MTINKDTSIGDTYLNSVYYNSSVYSIDGTILRDFLYSEFIVPFSYPWYGFLIFHFDDLPIHKKLIFRARVYT